MDFSCEFSRSGLSQGLETVTTEKVYITMKNWSWEQELYSEGGRNIAVLSLPPLGCLPSQITLYDGDGGCIEEPHNRVARKFNSALELMIEQMKPSFHGSRLLYLDTYSYFYQVVQNPQAYGNITSHHNTMRFGERKLKFRVLLTMSYLMFHKNSQSLGCSGSFDGCHNPSSEHANH